MLRVQDWIGGIISELLLWGVLVALLACLMFKLPVSPWCGAKTRPTQQGTLYFWDVSQLIVGSPVHFMGTYIGNVTRVTPVGKARSQVEVVFHTLPKSMRIPKGSRYTVEFNGLAGEKSLEILPPKPGGAAHADQYVEEPIRLRDVNNTQMLAAHSVEDSSAATLKTLSMFKTHNDLLTQANDVNRQITRTIQQMRSGTVTVQAAQQRLASQTGQVAKLLDQSQPLFARAIQLTRPQNLPGQLQALDRRNGHLQAQTRQAQARIQAMHQKGPALNTVPPVPDVAKSLQWLNRTAGFFSQDHSQWVQGLPLKVNATREMMHQAAERSRKLNTVVK